MAGAQAADVSDLGADNRWRHAGFRDIGRVAVELRRDEYRYVPFTSRLRSERWAQRVRGARAGWQVIVDSDPSPETDAAAATASSRGSAVMVTASGLVLPALESGAPLSLQFATTLSATKGRVYSIMGTAEDARLVESALGRPIGTSVEYLLMTLTPDALTMPPGAGAAEGLRYHRGAPGDVSRLFELQRGYEIEEVLLRPARFNEDSCRRQLRTSLRRELVLYATRRGLPVAKAGTNARGFAVDQIGGVYTLPELRSRGIGTAIMVQLLSRILSSGRSATLFVKPHNAAAIRLYEKLGFAVRGDYRIAYYFD